VEGSEGYGGEQAGAPLALGDVVATTFRTLGAHAGPLTMLAAAIVVPTTVVTVLLQVAQYQVTRGMSPAAPEAALASLAFVLASLAVALVSWMVGVVVHGAMLHLTLETLQGRAATTREALRAALPRFLPLLLTTFLVGIITVLGSMLCIAPGYVAMVWLAVAAPACFAERIGPIAAIQRSIELTEGHRLTVFLFYLVMTVTFGTLLCCVISPSMVTAFQQAQESLQSGRPADAAQDPLTPMALVSDVLGMGLQIVTMALFSIAPAVMYARLRGLRDGVDAKTVAQVFA
jgi:hypothetical protein